MSSWQLAWPAQPLANFVYQKPGVEGMYGAAFAPHCQPWWYQEKQILSIADCKIKFLIYRQNRYPGRCLWGRSYWVGSSQRQTGRTLSIPGLLMDLTIYCCDMHNVPVGMQ